MQKNVLVTGGAGFIGSHLVERLLAEGHEVRVVDNLSTGRLENLSSFSSNAKLQVHCCDVQNVARYIKGVDWVFHLAALADIVPSITHPLHYHEANVQGTVAVLEAAREEGVERFLYAASSSCYGLPDTFPTPENAPCRPMYPYALSKYVAEQYVMHWQQVYQLPALSLRLFNVYGPRARTNGTYGAVFGVFLKQKLDGKPFTVVGDGTQTRDFTYVTDVVDAFLTAAKSPIEGEILNVGSGGTYSVNHLVDLLGGERVYIPKRPGEPDCTFAQTDKIRHLLNWTPQVSLEEGVGRMLETLSDWEDAPLWEPKTIAEATEAWFKHLGNPISTPHC